MDCPACRTQLAMTERQGVEIDYCPSCRGVWLDRGELDKIIERVASTPSSSAPPVRGDRERSDPHWRDDDDEYRDVRRPGRRRGFLGELFDFD